MLMSLAISHTCRSNFLLTVTVLSACYQAYQLVIPYRPILTGHQLTADASYHGYMSIYSHWHPAKHLLWPQHRTHGNSICIFFKTSFMDHLIKQRHCKVVLRLVLTITMIYRPSHLLLLSCTNHAMFSVSLDRVLFVFSPCDGPSHSLIHT